MIDHATRMLAVDLQHAVATFEESDIKAKLDAISAKLGGFEVLPENWPAPLQLAYMLALVIQHIPAGLVSIKRDAPAITVTGDALPLPGAQGNKS